MTSTFDRKTARPLMALILFQIVCAAFFLSDIAEDIAEAGAIRLDDWHLLSELGASLGLVLAIAFEVRVVLGLLRRQAQMQQGLSVAAGALNAVMEGYFRDWGLTPAEADVATFTIKGYSISEIAALRGSAEGTIKTHLNAIYRKSGAPGRSQLVSLLVEDLLRAPLVDQKS